MALVTIHRVNTIKALQALDPRFGVEIDIRNNPATGRLYLSHNLGAGDDFESYIKEAASRACPLIILNIKEAGIEQKVIEIVSHYNCKNWFLLDVEFPFIYKAAYGTVEGLGGRIAIRYSEAEPIEQALRLSGSFMWVWVDVNSTLPLDTESYAKLRAAGYKLALVCPERWGRPQDIPTYIALMQEHGIKVDTIMTSLPHARTWEESGVLL